MFKMLTMGSAVLSCLTVSFQAVAQESEQSDCTLAEQYYSLAQDRLGMSAESEAAHPAELLGWQTIGFESQELDPSPGQIRRLLH